MKNPNVLIVEDEFSTASYIEEFLISQKYGVSGIASSGEKAISLATDLRPDLVLMDIMLDSDTDGIETAQEIQVKLDIPVIYVTGHSNDLLSKRALKTNPYGYILKPFNPNELKFNIDLALQKHRNGSLILEDSDLTGKDFDICIDCFEHLAANDEGELAFSEDFALDERRLASRTENINRINNELEKSYIRITSELIEAIDQEKAIEFLEKKEILTGEIRRQEEKLKNIVDNAPNGMVMMDTGLNVTYINRAGIDLFGYTEEDFNKGVNALDLVHPDDRLKFIKARTGFFSKKGVSSTDYRILRKDGSSIPVLYEAQPVYKNGKTSGFIASVTNISRLKNLQQQLGRLEEINRLIFEKTGDEIVLMDGHGKCLAVNSNAAKRVGEKPEDCINKRWLDAFPESFVEKRLKRIQEIIASGMPETEQIEYPLKTGSIWMLTNTVPCELNGADAVLSIHKDITDLKRLEKQQQANLKEKEILLKEVQHRVKNSMNVLASLLKLQIESVEHEESKTVLLDSIARVQTMSLLHKTLSDSGNSKIIDMQHYLTNLGRIIHRGHRFRGNVYLRIEAEKIKIGVEQASPVGLIVAELMTNSLKYAFPDKSAGEISISFKLISENEVELIIRDNGVGLPEHFDTAKPNSLGFSLVKSLAKTQLNGSLETRNDDGAVFIIRFNLDPVSANRIQ